MHHPAPDDQTGARPPGPDPTDATLVGEELSTIESDLGSVDAALEAIDRGDLDEAEALVSALDSEDSDADVEDAADIDDSDRLSSPPEPA